MTVLESQPEWNLFQEEYQPMAETWGLWLLKTNTQETWKQ